MAIIRFSDEEVFGVDSTEYEILVNAVANVGETPGAIVEIGSRRGGSAKMIIDTLVATGNNNRSMFCIDPYGNIDYPYTNKGLALHYGPDAVKDGDVDDAEKTTPIKLDYDNEMRNRTIPSLYYYGYNAGLNFTFFCLEDTEFFKRYADGVPVYDQRKTLETEYAFVFFDGPHDNASLNVECEFFVQRAPVGAVFVFDDIGMYDHNKVVEESHLFNNGFEVLEKGNTKASYVKRK
jgi:hypothetical protein